MMTGFIEQLQNSSLIYLDAQERWIEGQHHLMIDRSAEHMLGFVITNNIRLNLKMHDELPSDIRTPSLLPHLNVAEKVEEGELFFVPANSKMELYQEGHQTSRIVLICFQWLGNEGIFERFCESSSCGPVMHFRIPQALYFVQDFLRNESKQDVVSYYKRLAHLYEMVAALLEHIEYTSEVVDLNQYVWQTKEYMLKHYDATLDIEEIARLSGASKSRFYQSFKSHTGFTPNKFLTNTRLNMSLQLLAGSALSISEVAHKIGYQDEYYFSRLFKKHLGITPKHFATSTKKRIANLSPIFQKDLEFMGISPQFTLSRGWSKNPEKYVQQIEAYAPDLIFTSPIPNDLYQRLSQIAPVWMFYWKRHSWKDRLLEIGTALNIPTIAQWWLNEFEHKVQNNSNNGHSFCRNIQHNHRKVHLPLSPFL